MRAWRLDRASRVQSDVFSGEGARQNGGRWNHAGVPAVYASEHLSLAALERLVHVERFEREMTLTAYGIDLPDDAVEHLNPARLPINWKDDPPPEEARTPGTQWLNGIGALALAVPSSIVPWERNILINPRHPLFSRIAIVSREPFAFDPRLLKTRFRRTRE